MRLPTRSLAAFLGIVLLSGCSSDSKDHNDNNSDASQAGDVSGDAGGDVTGASGNGGTAGDPTNGGSGGSSEVAGNGGTDQAGTDQGGSGQGGAGGDSGGTSNEAGGGAGGGGGADNGDPDRSAGCSIAADQPFETFVKYTIMVDRGTGQTDPREFFVRLPAGYDQNRAYPTVIVGPGCGGTGDNAIPVQNASQGDAIIVGLNYNAQVTGRDCFMTESATSPELPFFDAALAQVESKYCMDKSRVFFGGFSSAAWLSNLLGCARSDVLRGQGNAEGGPPPLPTCRGPIAAILAHDSNDDQNGIGGGMAARDRILQANGCTGTDTTPWDAEFPVCQKYTGCPDAFPVVWCVTSGKGHQDQQPISTTGFWRFWSTLPKKPTP